MSDGEVWRPDVIAYPARGTPPILNPVQVGDVTCWDVTCWCGWRRLVGPDPDGHATRDLANTHYAEHPWWLARLPWLARLTRRT